MSEDTEAILSLNALKSELQEKIEQLECDNNGLEDKLNKLSAESVALTTAFNDEKENLESKLSTSAAEMLSVQSEFQSLLSIKNEIKEQYDVQVKQVEDLKNRFDSSEGGQARLLKDLENIQIQLNNSELKLCENIKELNDREAVITKLKDECGELEASNTAVQRQLEARSIEVMEKDKSMKLLEENIAKSDLELATLKSQIEDLTSHGVNLADSQNAVNESNGAKIYELKNTITQKESEISRLNGELLKIKDTKQNVDSTDAHLNQTIQEYEDAISMKENKIQELSESLRQFKDENALLSAQKERITNETEVEINACMTSISDNEETINNLQNELKDEQEKHEKELSELQKEIKATLTENEELSNQIQGEKKNSLLLQQNYNQLLATSEVSDSTKELITERDKAVKKSTLLTEKCKKLITKCKQQENQFKEQEGTLSSQLEELKKELENVTEELDAKARNLSKVEVERKKLEDASVITNEKIESLTEKLSTLDNENNAMKEKWQAEIMEKDARIQSLENLTTKTEESTAQNDVKDILSELQERIDFLEEAYEAQGHEKIETEERAEKLNDKLTQLKAERTDLYQTQTVLKEEILDLKKENSRLAHSLEDTKREIGKIRQSNIVSQMLDSPLLKAVAEEDPDMQGEDDAIEPMVKEETTNNIETPANFPLELKEGGDKDSQDENSFAGFENSENIGGWDDKQVDFDNDEEGPQTLSDQPQDAKLSQTRGIAKSIGKEEDKEENIGGWDDDEINFDNDKEESKDLLDQSQPVEPTQIEVVDTSMDKEEETVEMPIFKTNEQDSGDGWGGWDDEDLDLGDDVETKEKVDEEIPTVGQDNEISQIPQAMRVAPSSHILCHDDPPASLMSNTSGWGDDDDFGWGNEADLPGNLRLSAERQIIGVSHAQELKETNLEKGDNSLRMEKPSNLSKPQNRDNFEGKALSYKFL